MSPIRATDALARRLHAAGCRRAFGMPGGEVLTLIDALEAAGIAFVPCHHENAAGFIAEGAHHLDGAPAILVARVGPGAMNGVNVVANALQDRVPLIVLTGCVDADEVETYTHQVLDHRAVMAPATKATFRLTAGAAAVQADKAVRITTGGAGGRAGPLLIDVPLSVADAMVPDAMVHCPDAAPGAIGPEALARARAMLARAVVAFMGDAGFLMVAGELASAAALGLPVVLVVFVDRSPALIALKQRQRRMRNVGVDFGATDHAAIACAFGGHGVDVDDRAGPRAAMESALATDTFTLSAYDLDRRAYDGRI